MVAVGYFAPYAWKVVNTFMANPQGGWGQVGNNGSLPAGLSLVTLSSSGFVCNGDCTGIGAAQLVGQPTVAGTYVVQVQVSGADGYTWTSNFDFTVVPQLSGAVPPPPAADAGVPYSYTLQPVGGAAPYTWTAAAGALPSGISLGSDGSLTGSFSSTGTVGPFVVSVKDDLGATASVSVSVPVVADPLVTTTSLPVAQAGVAYNVTLSASGGVPRALPVNDFGDCTVSGTAVTGCTPGSSTEPAYLWSLAPGEQLPPGLSFDPATGTISGTPSPSAGSSATELRVSATDYWGATATQSLLLAVTDACAELGGNWDCPHPVRFPPYPAKF